MDRKLEWSDNISKYLLDKEGYANPGVKEASGYTFSNGYNKERGKEFTPMYMSTRKIPKRKRAL